MSKKIKNPAIFLDRDGVINIDRITDYTYRREHFIFYNDVFKALKSIPSQYQKIIITNQAGIAKGHYTEEEYQKLTKWYLGKLAKEKINIAKVYHCPHHPQGIVKKYKKNCNCRKPKTGMIRQAQKDLHLNLSHSWLIGDKSSDILAGKNAGLKTILVQTGYAGKDKLYPLEADFKAANLHEAIKLIKSNGKKDNQITKNFIETKSGAKTSKFFI